MALRVNPSVRAVPTENLHHASSPTPWRWPSISLIFSVIVLVATAAFAQSSFSFSLAPGSATVSGAASSCYRNANAPKGGASESACGSVAPKNSDSSDQDQVEASYDAASGDYGDEEASQDASGQDDKKRVRASRTESDQDENSCKASDSAGTQKDLRSSQQVDANADSDANHDASSKGRPTLETQFEGSSDSEDGHTSTITSTATVPLDNFSLTLSKQTVWAHDSVGSQRSEANTVSVHRDLSEIFGVDGKFGSVSTLRRSGLIGSFQAEADYRDATISASVTRDFVASSAQTIRANIWQTDFGLSTAYKLTEQLKSELEFHHKLYSDRNSSNEIEWSPQYLFDLLDSKLAVGYRFAYSAFAENTDDGYWTPRLALSHTAFVNWSYDWAKGYSRLELGLGRGSSVGGWSPEGNTVSRGYSGDVKAALGLRPTENTVIEYSLSADRSPGWNSSSSGFSLKYTF